MGTCWAIVAVETAMALHRIKTGEILTLSVRYLVDNTVGVSHGWAIEVGYYYMAKFGLPLETDYPYRRSDAILGKHFKKIRPSITHYVRLKKKGKHSIQKVLKALKRQPLAVSIQVSDEINNYKGGVITTWAVKYVKRDDEGCATVKWKVKDRDDNGRLKTVWIHDEEGLTSTGDDDNGYGLHALTLIGSGYEGDQHFWKLRNSYGPDWGEGGTVRIASDLRIFLEVMFPVYHPNRSERLKEEDKLYWRRYNRILRLQLRDDWTDNMERRFKRFLKEYHDDYYLDSVKDEEKSKGTNRRASALAALNSAFSSTPANKPTSATKPATEEQRRSQSETSSTVGFKSESVTEESKEASEVDEPVTVDPEVETNGEDSEPKAELEQEENGEEISQSTFSYEQLRAKSTDPVTGIDFKRREAYLSDEEFQSIFGMAEEEFYK